MPKNLGEKTKLVAGIAPISRSAGTANGTVIDRLGFLDAVVLLKVGAATGSPSAQGVAMKIQHGDAADGSDMADVTGAVIDALTADNAEAQLDIDLSGYKRYIRAVVITTFTGGTSPAIPSAVTIALGNSDIEPVS
ncbi:MAG: hypothetical protein ACOY9Y_10940 [Bacillota bacterium]